MDLATLQAMMVEVVRKRKHAAQRKQVGCRVAWGWGSKGARRSAAERR